MKFIAKFVKATYQSAEVEFEAENEEAAMAIINDEDEDLIWHEAESKMQDHGEYLPSMEFIKLEEKTAHDERVRKEEERRKWEKENLPF